MANPRQRHRAAAVIGQARMVAVLAAAAVAVDMAVAQEAALALTSTVVVVVAATWGEHVFLQVTAACRSSKATFARYPSLMKLR